MRQMVEKACRADWGIEHPLQEKRSATAGIRYGAPQEADSVPATEGLNGVFSNATIGRENAIQRHQRASPPPVESGQAPTRDYRVDHLQDPHRRKTPATTSCRAPPIPPGRASPWSLLTEQGGGLAHGTLREEARDFQAHVSTHASAHASARCCR